MSYKGYLVKPGNRPVTKKELRQLLGISESTKQRFCTEMKKHDLLKFEDNKIWPNQELFFRKEVNKKWVGKIIENGSNISRLYVHGIRSLYADNVEMSYEKLSNVFRILPYVNKESNALCWNSSETDSVEIDKMTLNDFMELLGYSKKNTSRIMKDLFGIRFSVGGKLQRFIHYVAANEQDSESWGIYINPYLYYSGNRQKEVEDLGDFIVEKSAG